MITEEEWWASLDLVSVWFKSFEADVDFQCIVNVSPAHCACPGLPDVVLRLRFAVTVLGFPLHPPVVCAVAGPCRRLSRATKKTKKQLETKQQKKQTTYFSSQQQELLQTQTKKKRNEWVNSAAGWTSVCRRLMGKKNKHYLSCSAFLFSEAFVCFSFMC